MLFICRFTEFCKAKVASAGTEGQSSIDSFLTTTGVHVYSQGHPRQKAITEAILQDLIISCNLPMSLVDNPHFRHFIHFLKMKCPRCHTLCEEGQPFCMRCNAIVEEEGEPGSLKDVTFDRGRSGATEDTLPMDSSSDEEDFHDASDLFLDLYLGKDEDTSQRVQADSLETEPSQQMDAAVAELSSPGEITVHYVGSDSVSLSWLPSDPARSYELTYSCDTQREILSIQGSNSANVEGLFPGTEYTFSVTSVTEDRNLSAVITMSMYTKPVPPDKVKIDQVSRESVSLSWDKPIGVVEACLVTCSCDGEEVQKITTESNTLTFSSLSPGVKYSFHVSTVLKNGTQSKSAVKYGRTKTHLESLLLDLGLEQHYTEKLTLSTVLQIDEKTVTDEPAQTLSALPWTFLKRLGECSLSKSQILNKLLSNPQQYHDTFVHHDMECGDSPRRISNGLVEISWYLPSGKKNIDIFGEAIAVTNLRGDISSFETQYSFLCQTSAAVFVFFDNLDTKYKLLTSQHTKAQLFLVGNTQSKSFSIDALKKAAAELNLKKSSIILKTKQINDADFVKNLRNTVGELIKNSKSKMPLEQMAEVAHELGILVDEDCKECQSAKQNADAITSKIHHTPQYKESQLPLQGQIWKELARLEKEECRLRKAGNQNLEMYKSELQTEKRQLREQQRRYDMSEAMTCFINAISSTGLERSYFLKWMRMNLDNMARKNLSSLRELYKEKSQNSSENKDEIEDLDRQISNSSLGTEHFLREMGQLYESAVLLEETEESRQQLKHLPRLCAELLLDGFPLELVDGDASNIPMRWVSDVLHQLNILVQPKSKILVVTVLGVQSTGKSTLLNTMFGVQFAVSSGRCTRGAFMLLIKVKDDFKKELNCDFLVIIDTEGLKSPELAQLNDSYEHDNELATLVVGLSDVTIINIAMENSTEMKDILQIVVHAFLRMKEVGKKPKCQFVHQNVADVSAHDKNMRDRKLLLEQLNEMTQAAARMENKEENKSFTDVMEYNPETGNWYIPGLWHGNPPMAPVNAGYSESVYEFKKNMIEVFQNCEASRNNIMDFLEWTKSLWNAVKYENFIFSFRNSLVADAYMKLCIEFSKWEWSFRKHMHTWMTNAEIRISNFGTIAMKYQTEDVRDFLRHLKSEASIELVKWEKTLLDNLTKYYEQADGHVYLVERYREDFANSTKSLKREIENSVLSKLEADVEIQQGMNKLDTIKKNYTVVMEKRVLKLLEDCRKNKYQRSDQELDREFEKVWEETVKELSFTGLKKEDIFKGKYLADFKDLFSGQDQCQKKAAEFTSLCLRPAVEAYVTNSLGPEIVDEMLMGQNALQFSSRTFFQYSILKQLLSAFNFDNYVSYICHYEAFVKNWILDEILKRFSQGNKMFELEKYQLNGIIKVINEAISKAQTEENSDIKELIQDICRELGEKLVIPQDALEATMILNSSNQEQFAHWLETSVLEMEQSLTEEFQKAGDVKKKLERQKIKPQNELFTRVFGCGKQCPFCEAPCEVGGEAHNEHCASIHRPQGLGKAYHRWLLSENDLTFKKACDIALGLELAHRDTIELSGYAECQKGVHKEAVEKELERLQKNNIIKKVERSDWATPIVVVPKKDKTVRMCSDYKVTVNRCILPEEYPLPNAEDLFATLAGGKVFSKMDLSFAYQQLKLDPVSEQYLTINTHKGLFRLNRLAYGISTAPAIFQHTMDQILDGIDNVVCFMADILMSAPTMEEHLVVLDKVM
ncbi:hypothetical protein J4Q44_G00056060 [Coregonus suidteri]|uniref:ribonuclease H n=1 Tax=Coregonus suidteri TaxID=861788 RepID=A0AAN8MAE0_9TELE